MNAPTSNPMALVTGASSGIGLELAKQFAQNSFDLIVVSAGERIDQAAATLRQYGQSVQSLQADLATHEGVHQLIDFLGSSGRPLDAVALNAGVGVSGRFTETDLAEELNMVALNVTSTLHLAKYVAREMVARRAGRILLLRLLPVRCRRPTRTSSPRQLRQ